MQVREAVTALRELDGPDLHTPVVMAVRGPKAQALAAELADTVTFVDAAADTRAETCGWRRTSAPSATSSLRATCRWSATLSPRSWPPDTDPAAFRAADSLAILPSDPAAATEEIQRRREEIGFSYFVFGADVADALAPVVAELAGH